MPKRKLSPHQKLNRKLTLTISMFLLSCDELKKLFWEVKSVDYNHESQKIRIGVDSTNGKHGTALSVLRRQAKPLSKHLHQNGVTFREAKITFFVNKEEQSIQKIYSILEKVENL